jgi:glycosyltransferase involved in cell wall biosynthesis
MPDWHIVSGEYPPQTGGVSDYSRRVALALARCGDRVQIWAPQFDGAESNDCGVEVNRLPGRFGPRALSILSRALERGGNQRILVQYVPHAFGYKAMNLLFAAWLYSQRRRNIDVMFHEVAYPFGGPWRHNILATVNRLMAAIVARSASRIFLSTASWEPIVRRLAPSSRPITVIPVPSNVPVVNDVSASAAIRLGMIGSHGTIVGHFGTYQGGIARALEVALPRILNSNENASALLLGSNSERFGSVLARTNPSIANRICATGVLSAHDTSIRISACDLMIQPYPDGISTRRTSAMAALSHGRALLTTTGALTEYLWAESGAVEMVPVNDIDALVTTARAIIGDRARREHLAVAGSRLYRERFDMPHTIRALRSIECESR